MSIVSGAFFYARGVFLPSMADDFGGSRLDVTLAFTIAQAVGAFAAPVIGLLLDRFHPRYILLGGHHHPRVDAGQGSEGLKGDRELVGAVSLVP